MIPPAGLSPERLLGCHTAILHDAMRAMGLCDFVLPRTLAPLSPGDRLAGPAWPASGGPTEATAHETLLGWIRLLSRVPSGHILVLQPHDDAVAHMGELSAETLKARGVLGAVIDGGCRDCARVIETGLPVWSRYRTPMDVVGRWLPARLGEPVDIGGVRIAVGDWILADADGVVRLPAASAAAIVAAAEAAMGQENRVRSAILAGVDPEAAYLAHGKF
ncbi:RraA family protein [Thermaurantiacus sp.]